ncbi:MAG: hypothetical protein U1E65_13710 [Myxococcota bacterium]
MQTSKKSLLRYLLLSVLGRAGLTVLLTVAVMLLGIGWWKRTESGVPSELWDQEKLEWRGAADSVILGDSRAGSGVLPKVLDDGLPGRKTLSFTFSNNGYTERYLTDAERVFAPPSGKPRSLILSVSPFALSEKQQKVSYTEVDHGKSYAWKWKHLTWLMANTRPFGKWNYIDRLRGKGERGWFRHHNADGSWTGYRVPPRPDLGPARVKAEYANAKASPEVMEGLLKAVRHYRSIGIQVYGFRPPTAPDLYELETAATGWDELHFPERFVEAGGVWFTLPPQPDGWESYDGSHIPPDRSERLSRYVLEVMKATEAGTPDPLIFSTKTSTIPSPVPDR